jgi:hypothetical protein
MVVPQRSATTEELSNKTMLGRNNPIWAMMKSDVIVHGNTSRTGSYSKSVDELTLAGQYGCHRGGT